MKKLTAADTIKELLRTYQDVTTLDSTEGWINGKPDSHTLVRPDNHPYFTGSYRQLETVLRHMRDGGGHVSHRDRKKLQGHYWAISATYLGERRTVDRQLQRRTKHHKTVTVTERRSEPITHKPVRAYDHDAGISWIVDEFRRRKIVPQLPREIHEYAAA